MVLRLNISTCPNDTFMFDALVHGRIDTEGLRFELSLMDIEQLNARLLSDEAEISKASYAVFPQLTNRYRILNSGSALGHGNGPLLVSRHRLYPDEMGDARVAIPGEHTTANLLLKKLFPKVKSTRPYLFSEIVQVVMSGEQDAGVLIHEGRFTYRDAGLQLVADLGKLWEERTALPLPLGAILVSNRLDHNLQQKIDRVLRRSVEHAFAHPAISEKFVKQYAQELSEEVIAQHINLFVNAQSINLGKEGRMAVRELLGLESEEVFV